ncbi:MAG TPA: carboxypeptidase regulatory-like domain-containing protein [Gemmatimonadaceae bacterium]|nr:carboxypeptidase regulatory-like domain-containing protein [Gemmatimonadaceae bacterium]
MNARILAVLALVAATPTHLFAQDLLRGRVRGPDSLGIKNATVSVLPAAAGATSRYTRTDSTGSWALQLDATAPSYTVTVTALGLAPQKITARRTADGQPIVVDVVLKRAAVQLETVRVSETRRRPPPRENIGIPNEQSASERGTGGAPGAVSLSDQGNLAAMAASVPGVSLIPDANGGPPTFSVLGLSGDQNNVTLNGMQFSGGDIPRDAIAFTRVTSTSFDVSRGGFSGGQLAIAAFSGGNFHQRSAHLTIDAQPLQFTDQVGRQLGSQYSNGQFSGSLLGPIIYDKLFYNAAFQIGRRNSDVQSLLSNDALSLQRIGVAPDSLQHLMTALGSNGIPIAASPINNKVRDNGSLLARIDWIKSQTVVGNFVVSARHTTSSALFLGATALPGHGGEEHASGGDVTGTLSAYLHKNILNDFRIGWHINDTRSDPYLTLPDARVLVVSQFPDSSAGITSLQFGGNPVLPRDARNSGAEVFNQVSWLSEDGRHRTRITANVRDDAFSQDQYANRLGSYFYNSIADVSANQPASFTRTFVSHPVSASALNSAVSIGDNWRPTDRSSLVYGVRAEGISFGDAPEYNPAVDNLFGVRTDHTPRELHVSPRAGFSLGIGNRGTAGITGAPRYFIRGGVGEFRNSTAATIIAPAMRATGLPDAVTQIQCVGSAVPIPDWTAFEGDPSTIPTQCVGGASSFASTQPNVFLIAPDFAAQRSWRGNLAVSGPFFTKWVVVGLEGIYSNNLHQQSPLDLNFNGLPQFYLSGEDNRPVYAAAGSIVPTTGAVTNRDSRLQQQFGSVTELTSNLRSESKQLIFTLSPLQFLPGFTWNLSYALQSVREQSRGFGGTTGGNPLDVEWARSSLDARHQINASITLRARDLFSLSFYSRFSSGTPFTPIVAGDINGDGFVNDRAFVYNTSASDTVVRAGMASLLATAPKRIRDCLTQQEGKIATRNSCEGPWTATSNAVITLNPQKLGMQNRVSLTLQMANVPAGLDELLHGPNHLQGWGQSSFSDPSLLTVAGFDASKGTYKYQVNQRFGDTRLTRTAARAPFLITIDARVQLGHLFVTQAVDQAMAPGRSRPNEKLTPAQLKLRATQSVFNPVSQLLAAKDSMTILTKPQLAQLTALQRKLNAQTDSIWDPVAEFLAKQPKDYDRRMVLDTVYQAQLRMFDRVAAAMREVKEILTAEQIRELPPFMLLAFDEKALMLTKPTMAFFPAF